MGREAEKPKYDPQRMRTGSATITRFYHFAEWTGAGTRMSSDSARDTSKNFASSLKTGGTRARDVDALTGSVAVSAARHSRGSGTRVTDKARDMEDVMSVLRYAVCGPDRFVARGAQRVCGFVLGTPGRGFRCRLATPCGAVGVLLGHQDAPGCKARTG